MKILYFYEDFFINAFTFKSKRSIIVVGKVTMNRNLTATTLGLKTYMDGQGWIEET